MSKAFVKESDDEAELPDGSPVVPAGFKNYMTPRSHRHMQDELRQLLRVERPKVVEIVAWAADQRRPVGKRRLHLRRAASARSIAASAF